MKNYLGMSCIGLVIAVGAFVQGQDPGTEPFSVAEPSPPVASVDPVLPGPGPLAPDVLEPSPFGPTSATTRRVGNDLQKALQEFSSAESDDDKSDAKKKVKSELEKQYDAFLERDQARVDQLFDRLKKLEEQLERRKEAKDRLVELKLEMLISQAEGLGWPSDNSGMIFRTPGASSPFDGDLYTPVEDGFLPPARVAPRTMIVPTQPPARVAPGTMVVPRQPRRSPSRN